ncbi:Splicing factor YJU2 [Camellia lanceoleosa]|uniref:Splicing factor YJU2 n=1 Tax=Camellia lanceoleosa TaxID=1840588 RepID=A0ACC0HG82_9ERIC|nr:Splicing factor YJU2 [Camellia lanceoleosa]
MEMLKHSILDHPLPSIVLVKVMSAKEMLFCLRRKFGKRTIAGRVVKESYGAAKQQHTFTHEVTLDEISTLCCLKDGYPCYGYNITYLGIQIFRFYFKCTKYSAELTIKTDPQNSDYVVESGASRNFEPWRAKDEEADKEKQKRETEEMGDAMKSLENRTLDSKREMDILAALG